MKHFSRIFAGVLAGVTLVVLGSGVTTPVMAKKRPPPSPSPSVCNSSAVQAALAPDPSQAPVLDGGNLASHKKTLDASFDETGVYFNGKSKDGGPTAAVGFTLAAIKRGNKSLKTKPNPQGGPDSVQSWSQCDNLAYRERADGVVEAVGLYSDHIDLAYVLQKSPISGQGKLRTESI
jgi:hypothetical protein